MASSWGACTPQPLSKNKNKIICFPSFIKQKQKRKSGGGLIMGRLLPLLPGPPSTARGPYASPSTETLGKCHISYNSLFSSLFQWFNYLVYCLFAGKKPPLYDIWGGQHEQPRGTAPLSQGVCTPRAPLPISSFGRLGKSPPMAFRNEMQKKGVSV